MASATAERATVGNEQLEQAAYERWIQSELSRDPSLTALRVLYNDIRDRQEVLPATWDYFDDQEMTGGAESLNTPHITLLTGEFDPADDQIVAAIAGGERVTYDSFTENGLAKSMLRAITNPNFAFQVIRDQIYYDNYHGPVKDMWRGATDYDTVIYVATFPEELLGQGLTGDLAIQELNYDAKNYKAFINIFQRRPDGIMEYAAVRVANGLKEPFVRYLAAHGHDAAELAQKETHELGGYVIKTTTKGQKLRVVAQTEAQLFDAGLEAQTGKPHWFGEDQESIDAYQLFKQFPQIWQAYRGYHYLLAGHLAGWPLDDRLYGYLVSLNAKVGHHVLEADQQMRLDAQLGASKITADMALACKKIITYSHYALLRDKLEEFKATGKVTNLHGADMLQAYGVAGGDSGGGAAQRGENFADCESGYGQSANAAAGLAAREGISIEEALRRLHQLPERWTQGVCRNCERETQVWKIEHGGCNVCKTCAAAHTDRQERGLADERTKALAEKDQQLAALRSLDAEIETALDKNETTDDIQLGDVRYLNGRRQIYMHWITLGSATAMWVDTETGQPVDE